MDIGEYIKTKKRIYTKMSHVQAVFGSTPDYDPDMRWQDEHIPWVSNDLIESIHREDSLVLSTGIPTCSVTLVRPTSGVWTKITTIKRRTIDGDLHGQSMIIPITLAYGGWANHLHLEKQCLVVGKVLLSTKDMTLLHHFLKGMPRKVMAAKYFVTVKAIEKRLTRIKEQLYVTAHPDDTLHELLDRLDLIPFLLAHANWFALCSSHRVHK